MMSDHGFLLMPYADAMRFARIIETSNRNRLKASARYQPKRDRPRNISQGFEILFDEVEEVTPKGTPPHRRSFKVLRRRLKPDAVEPGALVTFSKVMHEFSRVTGTLIKYEQDRLKRPAANHLPVLDPDRWNFDHYDFETGILHLISF
jgi:hypothetical protein